MTDRLSDRYVSSPTWLDWYSANLEAGRLLETRAEIIYFARKAEKRVSKDEGEFLRLAHASLHRRHLTGDLGVEERRTSATSPLDQFVDLAFEWAALALHAADVLTSTRRRLRQRSTTSTGATT